MAEKFQGHWGPDEAVTEVLSRVAMQAAKCIRLEVLTPVEASLMLYGFVETLPARRWTPDR